MYYLTQSQNHCDVEFITAVLKLGNSRLYYNKQQN